MPASVSKRQRLCAIAGLRCEWKGSPCDGWKVLRSDSPAMAPQPVKNCPTHRGNMLLPVQLQRATSVSASTCLTRSSVHLARYAARSVGFTAVPVIHGTAAVATTATCLCEAQW